MARADLTVHTFAMQVQPDLASRLTHAAACSGRSPEAFLREALSRLLESAIGPEDVSAQSDGHRGGFIPQPRGFSVYE